MKLSLIIPTYNERENIVNLLSRVKKEFEVHNIDGEIVVVDDNSPDGTGEIMENLKNTYSSLSVMHRPGKLGLSSAIHDGLRIAGGEIIGVMDADLSHPPERLSEMYNAVTSGAEIAIGSRYMALGRIEGSSWQRRLMSRGATILARIFTEVEDPMSGFFMFRRDLIKNIEINSRGFKILLEILVKTKPGKITEIPITFTDRRAGESKAGLGEIFFYLRNLWAYLPNRRNIVSEFFQFALVGILGTFVNLAFLYLLTEYAGIYYLISASLSFIISLTFNFILNKLWTFREMLKDKLMIKYGRFFAVALAAFGVNIFCLYVFTEFFDIYYVISQTLAIGVAFIINFIGNKKWTFTKNSSF
ncbi:hypothetical protein A3G06_00250 [Candidatus Nomurabacteria bacterium RIFCSPLOWO2_12_FULL_46_14]|uniref:Dolichol monophosphate mannose synthase n=1 Tax=Candidatus Nomurabacteria bacterium RIFCSPLOWO2_12_FULL_46_14 TaxID=1801797 RepID=A0A1F6Y8X4_9BACT|nr:MAG: hypothetical protein A2739_02335 [Candidatus Giovannonibacteria bacterium RIFCSPHIGHO2_01_FULL_43_100]OGJ02808.1 MAG: hypothetical protein A3G06_00250 [Candidatus Nomurabacteria bacterium RIFCSPLOWO2_12_FULL_46_14]